MDSFTSLMLLLIAALVPSLSKGLSTFSPTKYISSYTTNEDKTMCEDDYCDDADYNLWWFWLFLVVAIIFASLCCGVCCRLRLEQRRRRILILTGERRNSYSCYGTTEVIAPVILAPQHPGYNNYNPYGYPQTKLPGYTPTAENKGKPPPYT